MNMRIPQNDLQQFQRSLEAARDILVLTHKNPTTDSLAASLALYLVLPKVGKRVSVVCPDKVTVEVSNLIGIDKVSDTLGNQNFVISLDYIEGSIEKVSYTIEGDKFNLVIEPRPGFSFSSDKVSFADSHGSNADLIIAIGTARLEDLANLYQQTADLFQRADTVNIDTKAHNTRYGSLNLVYPQMESVSTLMTFLLQDLRLTIDSDIASNLLQGISSGTDNFSAPQTTAESFEAAALLLRSGAQKTGKQKMAATDQTAFANGGYFPPLSQNRASVRPRAAMPKPLARPQQFNSSSWQPTPPPYVAPKEEETSAPPDWLKPKIFKSRSSNINPPAAMVPSEGRGRTS